eukprot:765155-Hanusia_phi.AAC.3
MLNVSNSRAAASVDGVLDDIVRVAVVTAGEANNLALGCGVVSLSWASAFSLGILSCIALWKGGSSI